MDKYREKLKVRTTILSLVAAVTLLIYVGLLFYGDRLPELPSFIKGFQTGVVLGIELGVIAYIAKYMKALKNDVNLKKLFIEENDERTGLILRSAGTLTVSVTLVVLGIAATIAGFFNSLVFFTLLGALFFVIIIFYTMWIYFAKKL